MTAVCLHNMHSRIVADLPERQVARFAQGIRAAGQDLALSPYHSTAVA